MGKRYRVLYADPGWQFNDKLPGDTRGASKRYTTSGVEAICNMPIPALHADAWLFLWRVHTHQDEAKQVMKAWGFSYAAELVWIKQTKGGLIHFGMGRTVRNAHEVCLIGKRGKVQPIVRNVRSVFFAPAGEHSEKPERMYEIIETISKGPYYEMYARKRRAGWDQEGNQLAPADLAIDRCD